MAVGKLRNFKIRTIHWYNPNSLGIKGVKGTKSTLNKVHRKSQITKSII